MIRKDFIQRHFDELAKVLAAVFQLKNDHKPVEAETIINDFSNDFLNLSLDELLEAQGNVIDFLIQEKEFTLDHFKLLEDLLYHKHLLDPTNEDLTTLTLEVLNYVLKNDTNFSLERGTRINTLSKT